MRWLAVASVLLYLTRRSHAAVLKCSPESQDPLCASEKRDISTRLSSPPDAECLAGSEWESNCHSCRCSNSGVAECVKQNSCDRDVYEEPIRCKPLTSFKKDCDSCACLENGLALCTLIGCVGPVLSERRKRQVSQHDDKGKCKPGSTWKESCNSCWCTDAGLSVCTKIGCEGLHTRPRVEKSDTSQLAINTTKSSNNTKRVVCVANRMFIMDCNTCWCNEDGTSFFCTRRICTPDSTEENNTEDPEVEIKLRVIRKECRPNEVFELDCNMCHCNADGTSFSCTRRACVDFEEKNTTLTRKTRATQQEAAKACQPGSEFRMDCNKCLCNSEGLDFSCTRNDCGTNNGNGGAASFPARSKRDLTETVQQQCVPGSVFDRECNVCRCTEEGLHAICSIKRCKKETNEVETEPTPSFRCTPGDQFKRDCKDCTCAADGKNVFCTIRFCDEDLNNINNGQ